MLIDFTINIPNNLAKSTIIKRNQQLNAISKLFKNYTFNHIDSQIFDQKDFFLILNTFLNDKKEYTKRSYFYALMCFAKNNNCNFHTSIKLAQLYNQSKPLSKTLADIHAKDKVKRLLTADNHSCKILHFIFKHIGAIRLFELINTAFTNIPNKNFLDCVNNVWFFKATATKQKIDRQFNVSQQFIDDILKERISNTWLLTKKNGMPYQNTGSLSACIKKYTGINFQTIRRSDVHDNIRDNNDIAHAQIHAHILGHKLSTQINKYANQKPGEIPIGISGKLKPVVRLREKTEVM